MERKSVLRISAPFINGRIVFIALNFFFFFFKLLEFLTCESFPTLNLLKLCTDLPVLKSLLVANYYFKIDTEI